MKASLPSKATIPKILNYSLGIVLSILIVFLIVEMLNFILLYNNYDELYFFGIMSTNFINQITKLVELIFYQTETFIVNDEFLVTREV